MTPFLELKQVGKYYYHSTGLFRRKRISALKPLSFSIYPRETLALLGEAGSGKSTLAKILAGVEAPSQGEIHFKGDKCLPTESKSWAQNVRLIFQDSATSLNPALTVEKILDEPLRLNTQLNPEQRRAKIKDTLLKVGLLPEHLQFYPHMFSGGQKQRIALARAIILDPKLIILDEALATLDPSVRSQIINLLLRLQLDMGLSYLLCSHDLGLINHLSDRVIVLKEGELLESGTTEALFQHPKHSYTQRLLMSQKLRLCKT